MADENGTTSERQASLSPGWIPHTTAKTEADWFARGTEISERDGVGMITTTEQTYLPACEVVGFFDRLKPWKRDRMKKQDWIATRNPLKTFKSTTQWNWLLRLYKVRDLWAEAKRQYQTQNDDTWQPKHNSSVLWPLDIIQDMIDRHPRDEKVKDMGPKPVTAAVWKKRCETLLSEAKKPVPDKAVFAKVEAEIALDTMLPPIKLKATDNIEQRMDRVNKPPPDKSPEREAKARMLEQYEENIERFEVAHLDPRPISTDYEPTAVEFWRMMRQADEYEAALAAETALDDDDLDKWWAEAEIDHYYAERQLSVWDDDGGSSGKVAERPQADDDGAHNITDLTGLTDLAVDDDLIAELLAVPVANTRAIDPAIIEAWRKGIKKARGSLLGGFNLRALTRACPNAEDLDAFIPVLREMYPPVGEEPDFLNRRPDDRAIWWHSSGHGDWPTLIVLRDGHLHNVKGTYDLTPDQWRFDIEAARTRDGWNLKKLSAAVPENDDNFDAWMTILHNLYPPIGSRNTHRHIGYDLVWWCDEYALRWEINERKVVKQKASDPSLAPVLDI